MTWANKRMTCIFFFNYSNISKKTLKLKKIKQFLKYIRRLYYKNSNINIYNSKIKIKNQLKFQNTKKLKKIKNSKNI